MRGFWQQDPGNADCPLERPLPGCLGLLEPGTFDPVTRVLELAYYQDWNDTRGDYSVPYFLLGAGWAQPIAPRTWLTVDVMYDLIQDENSPYLDGSPRITTGISANF